MVLGTLMFGALVIFGLMLGALVLLGLTSLVNLQRLISPRPVDPWLTRRWLAATHPVAGKWRILPLGRTALST